MISKKGASPILLVFILIIVMVALGIVNLGTIISNKYALENAVVYRDNGHSLSIIIDSAKDINSNNNKIYAGSCYKFSLRERFRDYNSYNFFVNFDKLGGSKEIIDQTACDKFGGEWKNDVERDLPYVTLAGCELSNINPSDYNIEFSPVTSTGGILNFDEDTFQREGMIAVCNTHPTYTGTNSQRHASSWSGVITLTKKTNTIDLNDDTQSSDSDSTSGDNDGEYIAEKNTFFGSIKSFFSNLWASIKSIFGS
jgi:hypothetical protein